MTKIGLLPGGFKPPHVGHYKTALEALKKGLDRVIVYVGKGSSSTKLTTKAPRTAISQDISKEMWEAYTQGDKDIEIRKSNISPVADVYDFIDNEAEDGDALYFIKGERDLESARFANIPQHAKEVGKTITIDYINISEQTTDSGKEISGTLMRDYALGEEEQYQSISDKGRKLTRVKFSGKNTNKEKFFDGLPSKLGDGKKEYFWNKIRGGLEEELYDPNDHVLDYMKSSEWKAGMPDGHKDDDTSPVIKYNRGGMYAGGGMGAGGMYESKEGESELHIYDFDDTIAQVKTNIRVTITSPKGDYEKVLDVPSDKFPEVSKEMEAKFSMMNFDYDFSEFEKDIEGEIISSEVLNKLKTSLSNPSAQTTILTARTEGGPVDNFFKKIGLDAYVVPLGSLVGGKRVTGQDKADWIEKRIDYKKTIKRVYFIDDSAENRKAVYTLRDNNPELEFKIETPPPIEEMMGMMNKQEKAKHSKNMNRLSKDMSNMKGDNHGGGGHKVPDYVKGTLTRKLYEKKKMKTFSKDWWKEQLTEVITETKANTHLTHLEELVLTQGQDGFNQAKSFLYELIKNLKGEDNSIKNVSVKWDGAPAIWAGINPENGKFFVGTKSIFNAKTPKINYTPQDIDENHGHAGGLVKKLKLALQYLPAVGIKGILQGDFMFDSDDVNTEDIDGEAHYTFKPNTIRYAIEANSEIGKKILNAKVGIIWHTTYTDLSSESGASFGADVSGLSQTPNVWFDDAYFKDDTGILLSSEEEAFVIEKIKEADSINVDYDALPDELSSRAKTNMLNTYLNSEVRIGEFINNPNKSFERFKNWYQLAVDKSIEKVKRPETKEKKKQAGEEKLKIFDSKKDIVLNLFRVSKLLSEAKAIFITKYDKAVATKHFIDNGDGTLRVTKAEGFVAVDHTEKGIKLVDRLEFSKNNFNAGKPGS